MTENVREVAGERGLEVVPPIDDYGMMNDPLLLRLRKAATSGALRKWIGPGTNASGAFLVMKSAMGGIPLNVLAPLGGLAEPPFIGAAYWDQDRFNKFALELKRAENWHVCRIGGLCLKPAVQLRRALKAAKLNFRLHNYHSRIITGFKRYEDYFNSRSKNFRNGARSAWRKAQAAGFRLSGQVELEHWKILYAKRHPTMPDADYSITPEFHRFLGSLITELSPLQRLVQAGLWQGDKIAGAGLGICCGEVLYFYQTAHDPNLAEYRPGLIVFCEMIERAMKRGFKHIVFQSDSPYLMHYTNQVLELVETEVFAPGILPKMLFAYRTLKRAKPLH